MHSHTPDESLCPVCGQEYAEMVVLEPPLEWPDVYPGRAVEFFRRYNRRCSSQTDVDGEEETTVKRGAIAVYFHGGRESFGII